MTPEALTAVREAVAHAALFGDDDVPVLPHDPALDGADRALDGPAGAAAAHGALLGLGFWADDEASWAPDGGPPAHARLYGRVREDDGRTLCEWVRLSWTGPSGGRPGRFRPMADVADVSLPEARPEYLEHGSPVRTT